MIGSQLGKLTGVDLEAPTTLGKVMELAGRLDEVHGPTLALGIAVTVFRFVLRWRWPLAPGSLLAVVGAAVIVAVFGLEAQGVALVGPVPSGLPTPTLPAMSVSDVTALIGSAAAITFVGYSDVALTAGAFAARNGETIDPNREFLALAPRSAAGLWRRDVRVGVTNRDPGRDARPQQAAGSASVAVIVVVVAVPG
jgi:MFS superfamily sulfate permease-like transporter